MLHLLLTAGAAKRRGELCKVACLYRSTCSTRIPLVVLCSLLHCLDQESAEGRNIRSDLSRCISNTTSTSHCLFRWLQQRSLRMEAVVLPTATPVRGLPTGTAARSMVGGKYQSHPQPDPAFRNKICLARLYAYAYVFPAETQPSTAAPAAKVLSGTAVLHLRRHPHPPPHLPLLLPLRPRHPRHPHRRHPRHPRPPLSSRRSTQP